MQPILAVKIKKSALKEKAGLVNKPFNYSLLPITSKIPEDKFVKSKKQKIKFPNTFAFGNFGADNQSRTGDLILTKDALYLLSHSSIFATLLLYLNFHAKSSKILFYLKNTCKIFEFVINSKGKCVDEEKQ